MAGSVGVERQLTLLFDSEPGFELEVAVVLPAESTAGSLVVRLHPAAAARCSGTGVLLPEWVEQRRPSERPGNLCASSMAMLGQVVAGEPVTW